MKSNFVQNYSQCIISDWESWQTVHQGGKHRAFGNRFEGRIQFHCQTTFVIVGVWCMVHDSWFKLVWEFILWCAGLHFGFAPMVLATYYICLCNETFERFDLGLTIWIHTQADQMLHGPVFIISGAGADVTARWCNMYRVADNAKKRPMWHCIVFWNVTSDPCNILQVLAAGKIWYRNMFARVF